MDSQLFIGIVINYLLLFTLNVNQASVFKFTNVICESYNQSWITIDECRLKAVSRNITTLNLHADLHYPLNDIFLEAQMFKRANGYKPWLYKAKIDICAFLRKPYHPIVILIYKTIRSYSNANHTCPYAGSLFLKGFYLKADYLPNAIPTGDYLLSMKWLFDKKPHALLNIYASFVEDL